MGKQLDALCAETCVGCELRVCPRFPFEKNVLDREHGGCASKAILLATYIDRNKPVVGLDLEGLRAISKRLTYWEDGWAVGILNAHLAALEAGAQVCFECYGLTMIRCFMDRVDCDHCEIPPSLRNCDPCPTCKGSGRGYWLAGERKGKEASCPTPE